MSWVSNGALSCANPQWYSAPVCVCVCVCAVCKASVLEGLSGFSQNLQIMINYNCLAQTSLCSFTTPTLDFSGTVLSWKAFIWSTEVCYLYLQWKYWFFCSSAPDTLPQTHFYFCELWLKVEVSSTWLPLCHGHMLRSHLLLFLWAQTDWIVYTVSSRYKHIQRGSALEEQYWERADQAD